MISKKKSTKINASSKMYNKIHMQFFICHEMNCASNSGGARASECGRLGGNWILNTNSKCR